MGSKIANFQESEFQESAEVANPPEIQPEFQEDCRPPEIDVRVGCSGVAPSSVDCAAGQNVAHITACAAPPGVRSSSASRGAGSTSQSTSAMEDAHCEAMLEGGASVVPLVLSLVQRRKRRRTLAQWAAVLATMEDGAAEAQEEERAINCRRVYLRPDYSQSAWAIMLQQEEELGNPSSRKAKSFRRRFRLPYPVFLHLVSIVRERRWFPTRKEDVAGRKCIPLELKVSSMKTCWMSKQY